MTPLERFALEVLSARDSRQDALAQALSAGYPATLFVSLNIPGQEKTPPGAEAFFLWMSDRVDSVFPDSQELLSACDVLGPYVLLGLKIAPIAAKQRCIELETAHPSSRLIDLDVYSAEGGQVDRASLGLAARPCLVCDQRAVDCIRAKRHSFDEVIGKAHELLAPFRT